MQFNTAFSCGDKGWVFCGGDVQQLTIGKIEVHYTDSVGSDWPEFDNYKPQQGYEERYMCEESGIGSGTVYTLGKHIFKTKYACEAAHSELIAKIAANKLARELADKKYLLGKEQSLREQLEQIEKIKAEGI